MEINLVHKTLKIPELGIESITTKLCIEKWSTYTYVALRKYQLGVMVLTSRRGQLLSEIIFKLILNPRWSFIN